MMRLKLTILAAILSIMVAASGFAATATWSGVAKSNVLVTSKCAVLHYTVAIEGNKVKLHFEWPAIDRDVEANLAPDGTFATTYIGNKGDTVHVSGAIKGDAGTLSVGPRGSCGYKDIPLSK